MDGLSRVLDTMPPDSKTTITQVFREMSARLRRFVRQRVRSESDAEDILQEVWHRLVAAIEIHPVEQVGAWLFAVARHRIIDRARKRQPVSFSDLDAADDESDAAAWMPRDTRTPATEHLREQFWDQLHAALAELPPEQRQVFVWHEFEALSFQDIARLTGENVNTLLSRKRYAVLHLRRRLRALRDDMRSSS